MTPDRLAADEQGHEERRLRRPRPAITTGCPNSREPLGQRSLTSSGWRVSTTCFRTPMSGIGSSGNRTPRSIDVREADELRLAVDDGDVDDLCVEDLAQLVAHEVVHRLHVDLRRPGPAGRR